MAVLETKKQVLVADADDYYVKNLIHILEEHGIDVLTATSAQGVVQKASALDVDLVLLGEALSDARGVDLCDRLKNNRHTHHIPVVILSMDCQSQQRMKYYQSGVDDCIEKECESEELLTRIEAVWRRGNGEFRGQREERQSRVVKELSRIVDQGLIEPHFQPIYFLKPFRLFGFEVLSRPCSGNLLLTAEELFKAAIKYDMYCALEMLCWRKAMDVISTYTRNEHVFFNCSPYIVENRKFHMVKDLFGDGRISPDKVVLEITERSSIKEPDLFYQRLNEYRDYGFSFAIDDVGGGYSSLESIVAAKPEIVKIDGRIIHDLHHDPVKCSVVRFIVGFCRENQIISVAEGVETREDLDAVVALGVDAAQGYLFLRPTPDLNVRHMKDVCISFS